MSTPGCLSCAADPSGTCDPCWDAALARVAAEEAKADRLAPYTVRTGCGHLVTRKMRPSTAGVPWTADVVIEAPGGAPCAPCAAAKGSV